MALWLGRPGGLGGAWGFPGDVKRDPTAGAPPLPDCSNMAFLWLLSCFALVGAAFGECRAWGSVRPRRRLGRTSLAPSGFTAWPHQRGQRGSVRSEPWGPRQRSESPSLLLWASHPDRQAEAAGRRGVPLGLPEPSQEGGKE